MKKKYTVRFSEELVREVKIEAESSSEANDIANKMYREEKIVLDADDFCGEKIEIIREEEIEKENIQEEEQELER